MTGVLMSVLIAGVLIVEREVRRAAMVVTAHKLDESTSNFAGLVSQTAPSIIARLAPFSNDNAILRALASSRPSRNDAAAAAARLATLPNPATPGDSSLRVELWNAEGRLVAGVGDSLPASHQPALARISKSPGSVFLGNFFEDNGRIYYWSATPLHSNGTLHGFIVQRRRLNSQPATERTLASTAHADAVILISNSDGSLWSTLGGKRIPTPAEPDSVAGIPTFRVGGPGNHERAAIYSAHADRTPWTISMELPLAKLSQAPSDVVNRFAAISVILLVLGVIAVWIISRRLANPLVRMTAAAEAIARGDYSYRVPEDGGYETAKLGASFNRMATEVEAANRKLLAAAGRAEKAQATAESANAAKANFLAAMSHELRTPLNAIAGYVQLLEMGLRGPLSKEQLIDLDRIRKSQQYLLGLIEQVLVFTQLEAHKISIELQDLVLDELIKDTETLVKPQVAAREIRYDYKPADLDLVVRADRNKTQQIVINLVTNGAKYTNPGGRVTVSTEARNGDALVHVEDSGPGIPDEMLSHIFEPFVQLDRRLNQPREGVGLGLTISRDLARAMGGDLTVQSTLGVGSTFTLVLPRKNPG
jgi:signal transduction histidine kinase